MNIKQNTLIIGLLTATLTLAGCGQAESAKPKDQSPSTDTKTAAVKPYPLQTCLVSGEKLGGMGEPVIFNYKGQEIKFCCKNCKPDFEKDPDKYLAKLPK